MIYNPLYLLDPEVAHHVAIFLLKLNIFACYKNTEFKSLTSSVLNLQFKNPIGIAAGFDKNGDCINGIQSLGCAFVEVGTVTPKPQPGNPKKRLFRLTRDRAIINRMGFNNKGAHNLYKNLEKFNNNKKVIVGVNIGKNLNTKSPIEDYCFVLKLIYKFADYFAINVSSPNTPHLRDLQKYENLKELLQSLYKARVDAASLNQGIIKPIFLKIAPDLTDMEKEDIAKAVMECEIDGIIATNTTVNRDFKFFSSESSYNEVGGLSGLPISDISNKVLNDMYILTKKSIPIIGVGGIMCAQDAYKKIRLGASLVQLYSGLIFSGPFIINTIKNDLNNLLKRDGFNNVSEAVGVDSL